MTIQGRIDALKKQLSVSESGMLHLLAVSKTKSIHDIEEAIDAGQCAFGENYVQEAIQKIQVLNQKYTHLEWHYIGRIQNNKIKALAQYFDWVQTLESQASARKLNQACESWGRKMNVCLQVNISQESQKGGVSIVEIDALAAFIVQSCPHLRLRGLMTIGLATQDEARLKVMFCQLRVQYDILREKYLSVDTLSMGMSSDLALAVECGSTMLRIGTGFFGQR